MSFFDCVQAAMDDKDVAAKREFGERAQAMWKELSDRYEGQGHQRHIAEALAADDVKTAFRKEAGETRHVYLAKIENMRRLQQRAETKTADDIVWSQTKSVEDIDYETRALVRRFNGKLGQFLKDHHVDLLSRGKNPMQMNNFVREMHGMKTGDKRAAALAEGVQKSLEDMRLMFNEYGGTIGKLDDWGLPHSHNRNAIRKAGFDQWFEDIHRSIDWRRIEDNLTGIPFQKGDAVPDISIQKRFLREVYDNRLFGKESREAVYGKQSGSPKYKQRSDGRILHFKDADAWISYNTKYGNSAPLAAIMGHVHGMAHDISMMRAFGPNPSLGLNYQKQLFDKQARSLGDSKLADRVKANGDHAERMLRVLSGPNAPTGPIAEFMASFLSSTRQIVSAGLIDRAIVASMSDFNSMRLAAQAVGSNPGNIMSTYTKTIKGFVADGTLATDDLLRHQWVMDTLADPGAALARFQQEYAPSAIAEAVSGAAMKVQFLPQHTDAVRFAFQAEMWGNMARDAGKAFGDIDPNMRALLQEQGMTADEWAKFADPKFLHEAGNGATFLNPLVWRETTDLPAREADEIFLKAQSFIESWTEKAVPTQSLLMKGIFEPAAWGLTPGLPPYELMKSTTMFKSFVMAFSLNQHRMIMHKGGYTSKGGVSHMFNMAAGATIIGGMSVQINEILKGNDPMPIDSAHFWAKAAMKGGGFAIIGDIIQTGQTSWGGGFSDYLAGPMPQLLGDTWKLTIGNAVQAARGQDTNFAKELSTFGKRYTPMGQTPIVGPAIDRLFWDQLQLALDPESVKAMEQSAKAREKRDGNDSWWPVGKVAPERAPDLGAIFGS